MSTLVMKFGGSCVSDASQFSKIALLIQERLKKYSRIAVVVSAMGKTTDELMELANTVHPSPPKREQDMLISVGERVSISLLAMALDLKGIEAVSFTGSQSGIITTVEHGKARILDVRPHRLEKVLDQGKIVIVAGFQGVSEAGEITTLGRGGSDTSAVAIAARFRAARVEFYKDVPGMGKEDPKENPSTTIYSELSFEEALAIAENGARVLHPRCLRLAQKNGILLQIRPFYDPEKIGTTIGGNRYKSGSVEYEREELVYG